MDPRGRRRNRCAVVRAATKGDALTSAARGQVDEQTVGATVLRLVRHGETEWNALGLIQGHTDIPLNERGRSQATAAGRELAGREYAAIVTSPLARASETARILASALNVTTLHVEADLAEQAWGAAEGIAWNALGDAFPDGQIAGREPVSSLSARAERALLRIARVYRGRTVVVVTHGGLINVVNRLVSAGSSESRDGSRNGSISDIAVDPDRSDGQPPIVSATALGTERGPSPRRQSSN